MTTKLYAGIDQSPCHNGVVILDDTHVVTYWGHSTVKSECKPIPVSHIDIPKKMSKEHAVYLRLSLWREIWLTDRDRLESMECPHLRVACEDYAYTKPYGAHQIGEVSGIMRQIITEAGFKFRVYDPCSVKKFATHSGAAVKDEMVYWAKMDGFDVEKLGLVGDVATDIADAYWIAKCLRTEMMVREGRVKLEDLHQDHRDLFLRVTKHIPVNLLARPFYNEV